MTTSTNFSMALVWLKIQLRLENMLMERLLVRLLSLSNPPKMQTKPMKIATRSTLAVASSSCSQSLIKTMVTSSNTRLTTVQITFSSIKEVVLSQEAADMTEATEVIEVTEVTEVALVDNEVAAASVVEVVPISSKKKIITNHQQIEAGEFAKHQVVMDLTAHKFPNLRMMTIPTSNSLKKAPALSVFLTTLLNRIGSAASRFVACLSTLVFVRSETSLQTSELLSVILFLTNLMAKPLVTLLYSCMKMKRLTGQGRLWTNNMLATVTLMFSLLK